MNQTHVSLSTCSDLFFSPSRGNKTETGYSGADMERRARCALIVAVARDVIAHADELNRLDQAIGDGDHGTNMQRGFEAVLAVADDLAGMSESGALAAAGMLLLNDIGGASGPLYGTLALSMARYLPGTNGVSEWIEAFGLAIEDVKKRGKSEPGQKTLLDVLVPVYAALITGDHAAVARLASVAENAAETTRSMLAVRGRAAFLGQRSIGHVDPGAKSASLIFGAIGRVLVEEFDGK